MNKFNRLNTLRKYHPLGRLAVVAILFMMLSSCDGNVLYEKNERIPDASWNKNQKLEFHVEVTDTIKPHHIFVNVRNLNNYPMSNLSLFVSITSPDELFNRDTVLYYLAEPSGKWVGKGFGNVWSNRYRYKSNVRFPVSGTYRFEIEQAMRVDDLEGISDIGLRVEIVE
jgi:gliding motility-associated lipoprotein GldH